MKNFLPFSKTDKSQIKKITIGAILSTIMVCSAVYAYDFSAIGGIYPSGKKFIFDNANIQNKDFSEKFKIREWQEKIAAPFTKKLDAPVTTNSDISSVPEKILTWAVSSPVQETYSWWQTNTNDGEKIVSNQKITSEINLNAMNRLMEYQFENTIPFMPSMPIDTSRNESLAKTYVWSFSQQGMDPIAVSNAIQDNQAGQPTSSCDNPSWLPWYVRDSRTGCYIKKITKSPTNTSTKKTTNKRVVVQKTQITDPGNFSAIMSTLWSYSSQNSSMVGWYSSATPSSISFSKFGTMPSLIQTNPLCIGSLSCGNLYIPTRITNCNPAQQSCAQ